MAPTSLPATSFRTMSSLLALTLTFLTLTTSSPAALVLNRHLTQRSDICPVVFPVPTSANTRIVGGDSGDPFIRSHLISFHAEGCGGSVISKRWGITAGHCYVEVDSKATVGGTKSDNGVLVPIKRIIQHPDFSFPLNDIVLIEFAEDVPEGTNFVYVNADHSIPEIGEYTRSAGWGHTNEEDNPNTDNLLYQVDVPVVTTESCAKILTPLSPFLAEDINNKMHICAGYDTGLCDSCKADSGGPLVLYDQDDKLVQVGIVSFGVGCARVGVPGGYLRLSTYVDWMKSVGAEFTVKSERKPVYLKDVVGDAGESEEAPAQPSPPTSSVPDDPNPAPAAPSSPPAGTSAPSTSSSSPSDGGSPTTTQPQPSSGPDVSGSTKPGTTTVGPAAPATAEPVIDGGSGSDGEGTGPDTSSPGSDASSGSNTSSGSSGGSTSSGSSGEDVPEASGEDDPSATSGPDVSGNSGSVFAGGKPGDGGVNVGVVVGSCIGVLALVGAVFVVVLLRRRAAARSETTGTTDATEGAPTMTSEAPGAGGVASNV